MAPRTWFAATCALPLDGQGSLSEATAPAAIEEMAI